MSYSTHCSIPVLWSATASYQLRYGAEIAYIDKPGDNEPCTHRRLPLPIFDEKKARRMTRAEIKRNYPRTAAVCPDCGNTVVLYASYVHYIAGDW